MAVQPSKIWTDFSKIRMQITQKSYKSGTDMLYTLSVGYRKGLEFSNTESIERSVDEMFADARKKDGSHYKLSALKGIRFGLARHFQKEMDIDIIKYDLFKKANAIFKAFKVQLKRKGLGCVEHSPSLDEDDLQKLYGSVAMDISTPCGLQNKVWFDLMFFLCRRGRENLRTMNKNT